MAAFFVCKNVKMLLKSVDSNINYMIYYNHKRKTKGANNETHREKPYR